MKYSPKFPNLQSFEKIEAPQFGGGVGPKEIQNESHQRPTYE